MKNKFESGTFSNTVHGTFQFSFAIICSKHGSLKKFGYNWSATGKETNSSLDAFAGQIIFDFLLTIFSPHSNTKFIVL